MTIFYILILILSFIVAITSSILAVFMIMSVRIEYQMIHPKTKDDWRWP